ncbi:MAG TPA: RAQPRD family integrative conjugative element protein [Burkholderiaceae bacterium]|nr:RAQPRD family integrative conjugative element protein [Burkholderiaceae bacterium]
MSSLTMRRFIAMACIAGLPGLVHADADSEREALARISYELQQLQAQIAEASKQAPSGQRVRFRYDWLLRDLALVRQGVDEHLDAPEQPRPVPPLRGDYRQ